MKEFFKKVWAFIKKVYGEVRDRILAISSLRWFYFSAGLAVTAFSEIVLHIEFPFVLILALAVVACFARNWSSKPVDWKSVIAALIGGFIIQIFTWL